ncbi:MAG TPA: Ni/Fe-hydrogenase cytochrome b subunit [Longimicrobiales bacterium]
MTHVAAPVGGRIMTKPMKVLLAIVAIAVVMLIWRFAVGLRMTAMSDRYPWGIWIAYDVVTGTALACGGYAVAILVYILNKGRYHPLVRSAILTSALGYTLGGMSVVIDLGRWWNVWQVPILFWDWNLNSILLEVALCIMLYTLVLWIELSPAFLESWKKSGNTRLSNFANATLPPLEKALPWIIALGILLPTMHQSSLGSLMMLAGQKVHPLWQTPLLPLLFLISVVAMGYGAVVIESTLSSRFFKRPDEGKILYRLARVVAPITLVYVGLRVIDLVLRGKAGLIFTSGGFSLLFLIEMALFIAPVVMVYGKTAQRAGTLFRVAMLVLLAGALYRFSTFLVAFRPAEGWVYFPSIVEILVTMGVIAGEIAAYIFIVKKFPILSAPAPARPRVRPVPEDMLKNIGISPAASHSGAD